MIEINNKHIVLMLLIIIIGVFIYNYDVYVIPKNEPLCKPVFVLKREISPEIRAELNKTESEILKQTFNNLADVEYFENFENINNSESSQYDVPPKSFSSFTIPSITTQHKIKVIDSVIKILSYIPTNYCENQIKQMVEYFAIIYETSPNLEIFYKNIALSTKIKESPYNSKYSHLILYLIGKFDNDYLYCSNSQNLDTNCAMNELLKEIINKNIGLNSNSLINLNHTQIDKSNYDKIKNDKSDNKGIFSEYLAEQVNIAVDTQTGFNPKEVLNIIEKTKNNLNHTQPINSSQTTSNVILPNLSQTSSNTNLDSNKGTLINESNSINNIITDKKNYLNNQYSSNSKIPKYININESKKPSQQQKCNGSKCTYKCDSSYSNAISYLENELKPLESFGNIYDNYAIF